MKKIAKYLLVFLLILLSAVVVYSYSTKRKVEISHIKQKQTIVLHKKASQNGIYGIKINIAGTIKQEAALSLMLGDQTYRTKKLKNNFSFSWSGDWYSDTARIIYVPINVESGKVIIEYEFED